MHDVVLLQHLLVLFIISSVSRSSKTAHTSIITTTSVSYIIEILPLLSKWEVSYLATMIFT